VEKGRGVSGDKILKMSWVREHDMWAIQEFKTTGCLCTLVCLSILYHIFLIIKLLPSCFGLWMLWFFYLIHCVLRTIFQLIKCYVTSPIFILLIFNFQYVGLCLLYERNLVVWTRPELGHSIAEFQKCQVHPRLCECTNIYCCYFVVRNKFDRQFNVELSVVLQIPWDVSFWSLQNFIPSLLLSQW
jgi:hypothetical protein